MQLTEHRFEAHPDKGEVSAILLKPEGATHLLVLGHGAGAGMTHANMESIAQAMAEQKVATFRYQFPYMERGGGRDALPVSLATVRNAVVEAAKLEPELPLLAGGHSFGGRMTSLAAAEEALPGVRGLIFFSFPLHAPGKASDHRGAHLPDISVPMLFLSGDRDTFTDHAFFLPLIKKLGDKAKLHLLETGNHGYKILKRTRTNPDDIFVEIGKEVRAWLDTTFQ